jgi:hypothetical protein
LDLPKIDGDFRVPDLTKIVSGFNRDLSRAELRMNRKDPLVISE